MKSIITHFDWVIGGRPCVIRAFITPYDPGGRDCPPSPEEVEITVLDAGFWPCPELQSKLTKRDIDEIETEAFRVEREKRELV